MRDATDHNRLAAQFAERLRNETVFIDTRVAEINTFEARARGDGAPRKPKRSTRVTPIITPVPPATTAAPVATQGAIDMSIFETARPTSAYLKMGIMGKQGSGKSFTAAEVAIGLINHLKELGVDYAEKPVAFFDTETGSDWLIPKFNAAGIPLVVAKKRSFADLLTAIRWAETNASALIIDSITHPWRELMESYLKKKNRTRMEISDWGYVKGPYGWQQFSDLFVNSKLHIVMCGRAGDDLESYRDEDGRQQLEKVGVKMKTEGETGFEPSLLVLMEREMNTYTNKTAHRAYIMKDRSNLLDSKEFDDPGFKHFLPHINCLNLGGMHVGVQTGGDSQHILKTEKRDWAPVQRRIVLREIEDLLVLHHPSTGAEDKKKKILLVKECFQASWTEVEEVMPLEDLRAGYGLLHQKLEGKPSKYCSAIAKDAQSNEIDDSLPDFESSPGYAAAAA
jgi:hypothetical protein